MRVAASSIAVIWPVLRMAGEYGLHAGLADDRYGLRPAKGQH